MPYLFDPQEPRPRKAYSLYYGPPQRPNQFPPYTTAELERDLQSPSMDDATRAKIEAEIARRAALAKARA